jgi:hypothetical protein
MSFISISRSFRPSSAVHDILSGPIQARFLNPIHVRSLNTSKISFFEKEESSATTRKELETMVSDEKRGIFRVLDIGMPKPYSVRKPRRSDRRVIKAIPR